MRTVPHHPKTNIVIRIVVPVPISNATIRLIVIVPRPAAIFGWEMSDFYTAALYGKNKKKFDRCAVKRKKGKRVKVPKGKLVPHHPKTNIVIRIVVPVPISNATIRLKVSVPRRAANYPTRSTIAFEPSFAIGRCAFIIFLPAILYPFPHIATHIVQSEFVRFFLPYGVRFAARIVIIPSYLLQLFTTRVFKSFRLLSTARCILPLGFGG